MEFYDVLGPERAVSRWEEKSPFSLVHPEEQRGVLKIRTLWVHGTGCDTVANSPGAIGSRVAVGPASGHVGEIGAREVMEAYFELEK